VTTAVDRYLTRREKGLRREVITPEGVPIGFTLAQAGDRAAAFGLDMLIIYGTIVVLGLLSLFAGGDLSGGWVMPLLLVLVFLLQNFYFIFFELRWQGMTPGKRSVGIRVIDAHGGALSADALIARNLVRDVEVFVPLQVLLFSDQLFPGAPGWAVLLAVIWAFVFIFMPLFNKDRLRVGDMVAGTLVVLAPKAVLLPDVGLREQAARPGQAADYVFGEEQLGVYGIYELQVLEDLLRKTEAGQTRPEALEKVCQQIQQKIGWDAIRSGAVNHERFLRDFYVALRAHLERRMLFGKRRQDKYAKE
jgi:uncharacterized RDD family membrane protein YckC